MNPEALAAVVKELKRETEALKVSIAAYLRAGDISTNLSFSPFL